ncbi:MAG: hypothetical protein PHQ27_08970, partial [Victivallales bacterium]|nr:hypothetical protein [Victivallales bacterium]
ESNRSAYAFGSLPEVREALNFELGGDQIPDSAAVMITPETTINAPCFESNVFRRRFNNWIRAAVARYRDTELTLSGTVPHLCLAAAHPGRPQKAILPHWDIISMMDQWLWANRQLRKTGAAIRFAGHGPALELPSVAGLSYPAFPLESAAESES